MRCEEARPLISAGLDGELLGQRAAGLTDHLAECEHCRLEKAALAGTVRLLRMLPEAEPPAELRRRIGAALQEEERRAQSRWLGWTWLARPRTAGWTWGAAAGAMLAAVVLVSTRGGGHAHRVAVVPLPVSTPASTVASAPPSPVTDKPASRPKPRVTAAAAPVHPTPKADDPSLTAVLPPAQPLPAVLPPPQTLQRPPASPRSPAFVRRANVHQHPGIKLRSPRAASPKLARGGTGMEEKTSPRLASADRDAPRVTTLNPPDADTPASGDPLGSDELASTSGMTEMASTATAAPPVEAKDDLVELRARLKDRPLQAPELGQLRPASTSPAHRDGWIRF